MKINFLCNFVDGGWKPTDKRLGGTEESIVRWGEELVKRGHKVQVFCNPREWLAPTDYNGVAYAPSEMYKGGGDICINIKNSEMKPKEPTLYLTNETNANTLDLSAYTGVIWPSQYAVDSIPVNNKTFILPHGYDEKKVKHTSLKNKKQCLYSSSPDRGLETIEQIWPSIIENHPDAHLYVTYGGQINAPNVTCGDFTEEEMYDLYATSDVWLHPANGGELYCISGIKAQVSGAVPVYFPVMALQETVRHGVPCADARDMFFKLNALLGDEDKKAEIREKLSKEHYPNWRDSTDILESIIIEVCKKSQ